MQAALGEDRTAAINHQLMFLIYKAKGRVIGF